MSDSDDAELTALAAEIRQEHEAVERSIRASLTHARTAGEKLIHAKALVGHGKFMAWTEAHCRFSHSSALLYMNIAKEWDSLVNSQQLENLTLHEAAKLIRKLDPGPLLVGKDDYRNDTQVSRAVRLLCKSVNPFLAAGYKEDLYLDVLLLDRTWHSYQVEQVRECFFELRHRVNTAIEKLTQRMVVVVDEEDAAADARRQRAMKQLDQRIAEIDPTLLNLRDNYDRVMKIFDPGEEAMSAASR
jgi:hypothetical protein